MPIRLLAGASLMLLAATPLAAQTVLNTHRLSAALAHEAVGEAVASCAKQGYHVTATLIDEAGHHQAVLRGDGTDIHTLDSSEMKAYTAISFRTDTIDLVERAKKEGGPPSAVAKDPKMILAQGGVIIKVGEEVVGAIGVGGGPGNNIDTNCARAGLAKIADRLK